MDYAKKAADMAAQWYGNDNSDYLAAAQVYATLALVEAQKGSQIDIVPDGTQGAPKPLLEDGWYRETDDTVSGSWAVRDGRAYYRYSCDVVSDDSGDWWDLEEALNRFGPFVPMDES